MMWFKILAFCIAAICIGKAVVALVAPSLFYGFRRQQYGAAHIPISIIVMPLLVVMLAAVAWYATIMYYAAWGWIVTAFLSFFAFMGIKNLLRWSIHRATLLQAIATAESATRVRVDGGILGLGICFLILGFFVY
jgi:hypothetical protein